MYDLIKPVATIVSYKTLRQVSARKIFCCYRLKKNMQKLSAFKQLCVPKRETWCRKDGLVYPSLNFRNYMRYT